MDVLRELIAPAAAGAAVMAVLASVLFFALKRRDKGIKRDFELRRAEYKKYLQVLEEIVAATRIDLKESYTKIAGSILKDMLADPERSSDYTARLEAALDEQAKQMRQGFAGAVAELHGLRLVCSDGLLGMVNEFVKLEREQLEQSLALIASAKELDIDDPDVSTSGTMKEKAKRAEALLEQILEQMRAELPER
jgi:hypothetical protein